jgi:hypothetical protein
VGVSVGIGEEVTVKPSTVGVAVAVDPPLQPVNTQQISQQKKKDAAFMASTPFL